MWKRYWDLNVIWYFPNPRLVGVPSNDIMLSKNNLLSSLLQVEPLKKNHLVWRFSSARLCFFISLLVFLFFYCRLMKTRNFAIFFMLIVEFIYYTRSCRFAEALKKRSGYTRQYSESKQIHLFTISSLPMRRMLNQNLFS